jgi:PadR family transcriptional regulator, regulatory protein PadR
MPARELIAATTRPLLLGILAEGENYGYAIIQRVRELSNGQLEWTEGMLYPVLHRLEREGLITAEWKEGETSRKRKYYSLTQPGKKAATSEREEWLSVHQTLDALWNPATA